MNQTQNILNPNNWIKTYADELYGYAINKTGQTDLSEAYPTLIFVKPNGKIADKRVGLHTASQLIEIGKKVMNAK